MESVTEIPKWVSEPLYVYIYCEIIRNWKVLESEKKSSLPIHVTLIKVKLRVKLLPKIIFWNLFTLNSSILEVYKIENSEKKIDISANK